MGAQYQPQRSEVLLGQRKHAGFLELRTSARCLFYCQGYISWHECNAGQAIMGPRPTPTACSDTPSATPSAELNSDIRFSFLPGLYVVKKLMFVPICEKTSHLAINCEEAAPIKRIFDSRKRFLEILPRNVY